MNAPELYERYFIDKGDERRELFSMLAERYGIKSAIYPGSFVHITPAFYIPETAYVDSDRRMKRFFTSIDTHAYIDDQKQYSAPVQLRWSQEDYRVIDQSYRSYYDAMFSFYAGSISQVCRAYLRDGGLLVANNSHGDASLAIADPSYRPIGIILRNDSRFRIRDEDFDEYLVKKDGSDIDPLEVRAKGVGVAFKKSAFAYLFLKAAD